MDEISDQLKESDISISPSAIITCVGGGGLATGILLGMEKNPGFWSDTALVCMETQGSDCLARSLKEKKLVKLDKIATIAKSLGALAVTERLYQLATEKERVGPRVVPKVVSDQQALQACLE